MDLITIKDSRSHGYVYGKFRQKFRGNIINKKHLMKILKWYMRFPSHIQFEILDEMEKAGLLRKISRDKYEILIKDVRKYKDFYGNPLWD
jgi:hypothetical protein